MGVVGMVSSDELGKRKREREEEAEDAFKRLALAMGHSSGLASVSPAFQLHSCLRQLRRLDALHVF